MRRRRTEGRGPHPRPSRLAPAESRRCTCTTSLDTPIVLAVVLALGAAGCGGSGGLGDTRDGTPAQGKRGGTLIELWAADTDDLDPGITYFPLGTQIVRATQKTLYRPKVDDATVTKPDLADSQPQVSGDGCRVRVTLKRGVRFSPPVGREANSADAKYAIERGFFRSVNNGYAGIYFGSLLGANPGAKPGTRIPGIATPDAHTLVFRLEHPDAGGRCGGGLLAAALAMPLTAPVPREYAQRFDARSVSTYGVHQVATGPYMIEADRSGRTVGYQPQRRIRLVRNPNWNASLDDRPAYLDEIEIREGNADATVMSLRILEGHGMINGDQPPPPSVLRRALAERKDQVRLVPGGGTRWVAMNTTIPPFDNVDVRRAVIAGFDREAMLLTYGGRVSGALPTHFLPPGIRGFRQAGGLAGPRVDFLSRPRGDRDLAAEYFRRAGFPSGRYQGGKTFLMVGENQGVGADAALVAAEQFEKLGFHIRLRRLSADAMYSKFCGLPSAHVAICPNVGWVKDFADPQTFLDPTFNGERIRASRNSNFSQLNDHKINEQMRQAALLTRAAQRARAWGRIDDEITELAPAIPWQWATQANIRSEDVVGTIDLDNAVWSLADTWLR
jgi:peptide/nickel transport system substrate-binding protein